MNNDCDLSNASVLDEWRQSTSLQMNELCLFCSRRDMINFHKCYIGKIMPTCIE